MNIFLTGKDKDERDEHNWKQFFLIINSSHDIFTFWRDVHEIKQFSPMVNFVVPEILISTSLSHCKNAKASIHSIDGDSIKREVILLQL